jgi:hypothetical protein
VTNTALAVSVSGNLLGVAAGTNGVYLFDCSNPAQPQLAGVYDTEGNAQDLVLTGTNAYVADGFAVRVLDVSLPQSPRLIGTCGVLADGLAVSDGLVATYARPSWLNSELNVVDLSDPARPLVLGRLPLHENVSGIALDSELVCLVNDSYRMMLYDVSPRSTPRVIGRYHGEPPKCCWNGERPINPQVTIAGQYAFLSSMAGLDILDLSQPSNPVRVGGNTSLKAVQLAFTPDLILAAAGTNGCVVLNPFLPGVPANVRLKLTSGTAQDPAVVEVTGLPGLGVDLQRSADFQNWQTWTNVTLTTNTVRLQAPQGAPHQYYRAVAP